jgi:hypothetical protein
MALMYFPSLFVCFVTHRVFFLLASDGAGFGKLLGV